MNKNNSADSYSVGITIFVNKSGSLGLYENGLRQNVLFLYQMFKASANCRRVFLLNHGESDVVTDDVSKLGVERSAIVRTRDVADELDLVIVIGAAMDRDAVASLRARGCKIIHYMGGNGAIISMEASVARPPRPDAMRLFDHDYYDAIWMTPQHIFTFKGWCETVYRCPVHEVPQIWAPTFVDMHSLNSKEIGYKSGHSAWRVGVMDPNITVMKTSHMPMLVCEMAYRERPDAIKAIYVSNGWSYRDNPHFRSFTSSLTAARAGVLTLEPRFVAAQFLNNHCDAVVTHQWENGLNYLYYEVLYGGYPLIHNSPFLRDYGYYYSDFDASCGAAALLSAYYRHDQELEDYRKRNIGLFKRLAPIGEHAIHFHESLLYKLIGERR